MVNRCAITVQAKQAFLDWLRSLPDPVSVEMTLELINNEPHVYLLPEYEDANEQDKLLRQFFDIVFEMELDGWWTVEGDWPQNRNLKMFSKWFDIEFHSVVEDLVDAPLIDDE